MKMVMWLWFVNDSAAGAEFGVAGHTVKSR